MENRFFQLQPLRTRRAGQRGLRPGLQHGPPDAAVVPGGRHDGRVINQIWESVKNPNNFAVNPPQVSLRAAHCGQLDQPVPHGLQRSRRVGTAPNAPGPLSAPPDALGRRSELSFYLTQCTSCLFETHAFCSLGWRW